MDEGDSWMALISIERYSIEDYDGPKLPKKVYQYISVLTHHFGGGWPGTKLLIDFIGVIEINVVIKCWLYTAGAGTACLLKTFKIAKVPGKSQIQVILL